VRAKLERMTHNPSLWRVGHAWRGCISARPRLAATARIRQEAGGARPAYSWTSTGERNAGGPRP
jgi:hypothetical protein